MPPAFPLPAAPPTIEELTAMLKRIKALTPTKATPAKAVPAKAVPAKEKASAAYLNDDWATMGDWVGRYGRQFGLLWAIEAPYSNSYGSSLYLPAPKGHIYWVEARIGTNRDKDDALRHWKHWLKTDNPNVLYYPDAGYRRETEIDDHGEGYPQWHEGPDIWMLVDVPEGMQRMSLYFFNKDGHEDANRYRNYTVEVRECLSDTTRFHAERFWSPGWNPSGTQVEQFSDYQIKLASKQPVLASARVRDFWGGVYKSFAVSGGHFYWVKIAKNDSQNVICQSIFLDHLKLPVADKEGDWDTEYSTNMDPHFPPDLQVEISYLVEKDAKGQPMRRLEYTSLKDVQTNDPKVPLRLRLAMHLWKAVDDASESPQVALLQRRARLMAYRVVYDADKNQPTTWSAGEAPKYRVYAGEALKNWSWHLGLWSPLAGDDRKNFRDVMATAWDNYATINPDERKDYAH